MTNYVLTKPKLNVCDDLHNKLKKMDFDDIINNPETHFQNAYVTNFDLIHDWARGDPLCYSKKFYYQFVAAAIKSQRDDV